MKDLDFIDNLMDEDDYRKLRERVAKAKNDLLMEEPCPIYEATDEDWDDFWYNEDTSGTVSGT
jgi:hypothetical protein